MLTQKKRQEAPKVYALHAPEVECIGKGKAHKPYEFGVKVSLATTVAASKGGQFILHAKALPGNPYDGHTLKTVLPGIEAMTGAALSRILADAGYKGHNAPKEHTFKVYTQGQKRGVTKAIKRLFKRRAAIEPVIGHCKGDHRMGRNVLAHRHGDAIKAVLAAAGYNFRRLLAWLAILLRMMLDAFMRPTPTAKSLKRQKFTVDHPAKATLMRDQAPTFLRRGSRFDRDEGTTARTPAPYSAARSGVLSPPPPKRFSI